MAWVQQNGRWVKQPDGRPRAGAATERPVAINAMTAEFARNPLAFMKKHPMQPANGSTVGGVTTVEWAIDESELEGANFDNTGTERILTSPLYRTNRHTGAKQLTGQRINMTGAPKYMSLFNAGALAGPSTNRLTVQGRAGEVIPLLSDTPYASGAQGIPVWWLPWQSYKVTEFNIPPVPSNLVDPPEEEYPRFFLTASINGCSVFARGDATSPTVFHAGVADKIRSGNAKAFWTRQLQMAQAGFDTAAVSGAVHKDEYMQLSPGGPEALAAKRYLEWLKEGETDGRPLTLDITTGYGCVFGVRYGRLWTLYLQEILNIKSIKMYKKSDVRKSGGGFVGPGNVALQQTVQKTPGRFFGTNTSKLYSSTTTQVVPMKVVEFYPNRHWSGSLGGQKVAMSRM